MQSKQVKHSKDNCSLQCKKKGRPRWDSNPRHCTLAEGSTNTATEFYTTANLKPLCSIWHSTALESKNEKLVETNKLRLPLQQLTSYSLKEQHQSLCHTHIKRYIVLMIVKTE